MCAKDVIEDAIVALCRIAECDTLCPSLDKDVFVYAAGRRRRYTSDMLNGKYEDCEGGIRTDRRMMGRSSC